MTYQDSSLTPESMPVPPAIPLTATEQGRIRLAFLRRTYALFLLGLLVTGVGAVWALTTEAVLMAVVNYIWIALILQHAAVAELLRQAGAV